MAWSIRQHSCNALYWYTEKLVGIFPVKRWPQRRRGYLANGVPNQSAASSGSQTKDGIAIQLRFEQDELGPGNAAHTASPDFHVIFKALECFAFIWKPTRLHNAA